MKKQKSAAVKTAGISTRPGASPRRKTQTPQAAPTPGVTVNLDETLSLEVRWLSQRFGRTEDEIVTGFLLDNVPRLMAACTEGADEPEEIAAMTRWFAVARNRLAAPRAT